MIKTKLIRFQSNITSSCIRGISLRHLYKSFSTRDTVFEQDGKRRDLGASSFFQGKDLETILRDNVKEKEKIKDGENKKDTSEGSSKTNEKNTNEREEVLIDLNSNKVFLNDPIPNELNSHIKDLPIINEKKVNESTEGNKYNIDTKKIYEQLIQNMIKINKSVKSKLEPFKKIEWKKVAEDPKQFLSSTSKAINDATGYAEIEKLKLMIETTAKQFEEARLSLRQSKESYQQQVEKRAMGQRDINELLQRKHLWNDKDVTQFTQLYREEHNNESLESQLKLDCKENEEKVEQLYAKLVSDIRTRYHEEQLWSDKIRGVSTYWTLALIIINMLLFISVHTIFEPRKREKLVNKVNEKFSKQWENEKENINSMIAPLVEQIQQQKEDYRSLAPKIESIQNHLLNYSNQDKTEKSYEQELAQLVSDLLNEQKIMDNNINTNKSTNNTFNLTTEQMYLSIGSALAGAVASFLLKSMF
ncbi:hypothetical protein K502DRAFT_322678 [Neoconidiobolus thromboides FSU 785]|nr:hypothetical protein K502DRAFT_322678 [Neoconidiobolus thromboides FSU 785]